METDETEAKVDLSTGQGAASEEGSETVMVEEGWDRASEEDAARQSNDNLFITATFLVILVVVIFILMRVNRAIKLLNNRVNILSSSQKNLTRELHSQLGTPVDDALDRMDSELRERLERDFR